MRKACGVVFSLLIFFSLTPAIQAWDTANPGKPGFFLIEMNDSRLPDFGSFKLAVVWESGHWKSRRCHAGRFGDLPEENHRQVKTYGATSQSCQSVDSRLG